MAWLKRQGRFAHALQADTLDTLYQELPRDMATLLCKPKRKRQTSQQWLDTTRHSREDCPQEEAVREDQAA